MSKKEIKAELQELILEFFETGDWDHCDNVLQRITNLVIRLPYPNETANILCTSGMLAVQDVAMDFMRIQDKYPENPKASDEKILALNRFAAFRALKSLDEIIDLSSY